MPSKKVPLGRPSKIVRRVFVSVPGDHALTKSEIEFKRAVLGHIESLGYQLEIFFNPDSSEGIAARLSWTPQAVEDVIRHCVGGVIIGLPRWRLGNQQGARGMPTEYSQYEGAILRTMHLPILALVQAGVQARGVFEHNFGQFIGTFPDDADARWLESRVFKQAMNIWKANMADRRDLFLGYCSSSEKVAAAIKEYVSRDLGASVLDWKVDFGVARSVLEEIVLAAKLCSGGIFLFTKDDQIAAARGGNSLAVPRDNVVFEAGYFIAAKGKRRSLVSRPRSPITHELAFVPDRRWRGWPPPSLST